MRQSKSRSFEQIGTDSDSLPGPKISQEAAITKIIYPQIREPHSISIIKEARQNQEQQKETPKLISKFQSKQDIRFNQKSFSHSDDQQQTRSKKSKLSKYQPKIVDSFAVIKPNPENSQLREFSSRSSRRPRITSENHILQKSNGKTNDLIPLHRSSSQKMQRLLTEVVKNCGIPHEVNQYKQYTDLKGIHQFIRKKKGSEASSMLGKAYTEPPQKLQIIREVGRSSSLKFNSLEKKMGVKSQSKSKAKLDLFRQFNKISHLPEIEKNQSLSKLLKKKIKTETPTPNFLKEDFKKQLKSKVNIQLNRSKSPNFKQPSAKRLRQDFKYVLQKDDSQRFHKRSKPLLNQEQKQVRFLKMKEQMLGKIVLQRVQKHLYQQKRQKANYISKVKSEKSIDEALIQFLKMKVKRVDKALNN